MDKRVKVLVHAPSKPFNKMTIADVQFELFQIKRDITTLNAEIESAKTGGSIASGVIFTDTPERQEYIDSCISEMDKLFKRKSALKSARNSANNRCQIAIDGETMSLNRANSVIESMTEEIEYRNGYGGFRGFGNVTGFYNESLNSQLRAKQDYLNRLKEAVRLANSDPANVILAEEFSL